MRTLFAVVLLVFSGLFLSCSDKSEYVVEAELSNLSDQPLYVIHDRFRAGMNLDTIRPVNNFFQFKGSSEALTRVNILNPDRTLLLRLYLQNGDRVKLTGDVEVPGEIKISGSNTNEELGKFRNENSVVLGRITEVEKKYALDKDLSAYYSDITRLRDSLYYPVKKYVTENTSSPVSALLIYEYLLDDVNFKRCDSLYKSIDPEGKPTNIQALVELFLENVKKTDIGKRLPYFAFKSDKDSMLYTSSFIGKPTLVTCWTADDNASIQEILSQRDIYRKTDKKKLNMVSFSLDPDSIGWKRQIKADSLNWRHLRIPDGWNDRWVKQIGITRIPYTLVLDKTGTIVARNLYGKELEDYILKMLADTEKKEKNK